LLDDRIESGARGFLSQCRSAVGQYVELEYKNSGAKRCAYLQCRTVYETGGLESCLSENTAITLADGSVKKVQDVQLGDKVKSSDGVHKVIAANRYQSALRVMYGINGGGALLTGDHPIKTTAGWKVITPEAAKLYAEMPGFARDALAVGDTIVTDKGPVKVTSIDRHAAVDPISTYNLKVEGNSGFFANGVEVKGFDKMEMHYK
jgi:Hint-domain